MLGSNPWSKPLADLRRRKGNTPKRLPGWQVWQRDHDKEVREEAGEDAHISLRNSVAVRQFQDQDDEVRARAIQKAKSENEAAREAHTKAKSMRPSVEAAEQSR